MHDSKHDLGVDPGLQKDGVEAHLQELLAEHVTTLGEGWSLGVGQLTRYLELLNRDSLLAPVKGVFAAQLIKPQARTLAEDRHPVRGAGLRRPARHQLRRVPPVLTDRPHHLASYSPAPGDDARWQHQMCTVNREP